MKPLLMTEIENEEVEQAPIPGEKLQKVLARAGLGSRREMERAISAGKVKVNGKIAALGERVCDEDSIYYNDKRLGRGVREAQPLRVLLYNKSEGEICSRVDPEGRPTVYGKLPRLKSGRWISVGRLDFNTSGLLLFTNEGELANKLMHPSSNIDREYLVRVQGAVNEDMITRLKDGVMLEDGMAKFTDVIPGSEGGSNAWFYCAVMEGKNREVRRLWESQEVRVSRLKRVRYGNIFIPSHVRVGQWIELSYQEVVELCETAAYPRPPKPNFSSQLKKRRERHEYKLRSRTMKKASIRNRKK